MPLVCECASVLVFEGSHRVHRAGPSTQMKYMCYCIHALTFCSFAEPKFKQFGCTNDISFVNSTDGRTTNAEFTPQSPIFLIYPDSLQRREGK